MVVPHKMAIYNEKIDDKAGNVGVSQNKKPKKKSIFWGYPYFKKPPYGPLFFNVMKLYIWTHISIHSKLCSLLKRDNEGVADILPYTQLWFVVGCIGSVDFQVS